MSIIEEQLLKEKIDSRDYAWFSSGGNRSRVKRFLKTNQVSSALLFDLWSVRELRYDLTSLQQLPEDIIIEIIKNAGSKSRDITRAMFTETLLKQEITYDIVNQHINLLELGMYFLAWETIPKTMLLHGNFDTFMQLICGMNNDFFTYQKERKGAIVAVARAENTKLDEIVEFLCSMPTHVSYELITALSKVIFFSDGLVSFMRTNLDGNSFYSVMEHIITRNNCSINAKARFLLEK